MRQTKYISIVMIISILFWSCGSTYDSAGNSRESQLNELRELLDTKSFKFIAETAHPMQTYAVTQVTNALLRNTGNTSGTIFLTGRGDYLKVMGDTITAELSYFGELRMVSSIDPRDSGINFTGELSNFSIKESKKKKKLNVEFDVKTKIDKYNIIMQLYPSQRANIVVNSSNRTSIRYEGEIVRLDKKEKASE